VDHIAVFTTIQVDEVKRIHPLIVCCIEKKILRSLSHGGKCDGRKPNEKKEKRQKEIVQLKIAVVE